MIGAAQYAGNAMFVSDAQLQRFKRDVTRRLLNTGDAIYSVLEAGCEVAETDRLFADDLAWLDKRDGVATC